MPVGTPIALFLAMRRPQALRAATAPTMAKTGSSFEIHVNPN
jgi:hypothetical protein